MRKLLSLYLIVIFVLISVMLGCSSGQSTPESLFPVKVFTGTILEIYPAEQTKTWYYLKARLDFLPKFKRNTLISSQMLKSTGLEVGHKIYFVVVESKPITEFSPVFISEKLAKEMMKQGKWELKN